MAETKAVAKATPTQSITYKLSNGESVSLNEAAVRKLTNNNQYITQGEISLFIETCKYQKLNPFVGEAYLVKYDSSKPASRVVSLAAFMRIADEQKTYDGIEDGIIIANAKGEYIDREGCILLNGETLIGGWANVYRTDRSHPFRARVTFREYNKGMAQWKSMPAVMINKVAKVTALRKAFPAALNGCYVEEEVEQKPISPEKADRAFDAAFDEQIYEIPEDQTTLPLGEPAADEDTPFAAEDEAVDDFATVDDTPTATKRIPYAEYTENKSKYEKVPNSYDQATKTIEVYERG